MKLTSRSFSRFIPSARQIMPAMNILSFAAFSYIAFADPLLAQNWSTGNGKILKQSCNFLGRIKDWIFGITYVLGAIGLVLIAISAFLGRFKFAHLISLGGGLFVVAAADLLISFVTAGTDADCSTENAG